MKIQMFYDECYIRLDGNDFGEEKAKSPLPNFDILFAMIAKEVVSNGKLVLYDSDTQTVFPKRTKIFIVNCVNDLIRRLTDTFSDSVNMRKTASLRQLKKLLNSFQRRKKEVSCYGLVYLYVIATHLPKTSEMNQECKDAIDMLYNLIYCFLQNNPENELACFFVGTYMPIQYALVTPCAKLTPDQLPPRPRKQPKFPELE